ncbi:hypothetical protein GWK47_010838 [Chionoecetes opilio]|uniref:Uncharacterized protein n=1 Tax=Chionoecetes opilio TaxID=41210 RepID=A0A8J5CMI9_CHIOP|nr:hypothetical protein GWK47_010838 [Chionoecetes opilio]
MPCTRREETVVITHRLLEGAAGPPNAASQGQREAHHHLSWAAYRALGAGEGVSAQLDPHHVGVRGNEAAARGRQSEPPRPHVTMHVPSQLTQLKARKGGRSTPRSPDETESWRPGRGRAAWYAAGH